MTDEELLEAWKRGELTVTEPADPIADLVDWQIANGPDYVKWCETCQWVWTSYQTDCPRCGVTR